MSFGCRGNTSKKQQLTRHLHENTLDAPFWHAGSGLGFLGLGSSLFGFAGGGDKNGGRKTMLKQVQNSGLSKHASRSTSHGRPLDHAFVPSLAYSATKIQNFLSANSTCFNIMRAQPEGAPSMRALINFSARRSCFSHHMMLACSSASLRLTRQYLCCCSYSL